MGIRVPRLGALRHPQHPIGSHEGPLLRYRVIVTCPDGLDIQLDEGPFILWDMCTKENGLCNGVHTPRIHVSGERAQAAHCAP